MTITKYTFLAISVAAATLASHQQARAAENQAPTSGASSEGITALRERMQETARELKLTPEQTARLQTIVRERAEKLRQLRQDTTLSPEEKRQKLMTARADLVSEVKKILTPEQFEIWRARQGEVAGRPARPLARLQQAINDLNLTEDQKEQLKPLYQEQMDKLRGLYLDPNLSMADKLDKLKGIRQEAAPKLKKVLSAEQYAAMERDINQWLDQMKQRFQDQR
jgi:periplasmic protein CpxP/Spy